MAINEEVYKNLGLKGFLGALPERIYKHLGSLGHVGTISDRLFKEGGYLSYITNLLGVVSRYFVTLDPVLNSYYEVASPITFTGDFEIEFEVSGQDLTSDQALIDSSVFNKLVAGEILLYIDNPNGLDLLICDGANGFNRQTFGGQSEILNSKLNTISLNRLNGVITSKLNNVQLGGSITNSETIRFSEKLIGGGNSRKFNGIIANAKFTDQSGASDVVTTFKLDQATANTESSVEGNNSVTYVNIPQSARDLYTLDGNIWTDAAGNTIEVAP